MVLMGAMMAEGPQFAVGVLLMTAGTGMMFITIKSNVILSEIRIKVTAYARQKKTKFPNGAQSAGASITAAIGKQGRAASERKNSGYGQNGAA